METREDENVANSGTRPLRGCHRKVEAQQSAVSTSFLRLMEGDVAQFRGDAIVSDVNDCLPQDDDSSCEDVKPSIVELSQLTHGALDGAVRQASEEDNNKNVDGVEILRTKGPRCATHGVATRTEEIALRLCYWKCLKSAVDRGLLQIGFPLIGTGLGGYPRSEGLMVALDTVLAFFEENPVKGLNVSICVSGAGARNVLEFGALLIGNVDLSFKLGMGKDTTSTVHRFRMTMEKAFTKLMGLSEKPRKAYDLPITNIAFRTYVKTWTEDEKNLRHNDYRKRKRMRQREGKAKGEVKSEPLDEMEDDAFFGETRENMMLLANPVTPEAEPECSTSNDVPHVEDFVANFFGPSETAERIRLLKEEEVEKVENDEQKPPCLHPEDVALSMFAQGTMFNGTGNVTNPSKTGTCVVNKRKKRLKEEEQKERGLRREIDAEGNMRTSTIRRSGIGIQTEAEKQRRRRLRRAKENMDRRAGIESNAARQRQLIRLRESKRRLEAEAEEEHQQRVRLARECASKRLPSETPEQYGRRLAQAIQYMKKLLAPAPEETPKQRERRLALRQKRRLMGEKCQRFLAEYRKRKKRNRTEAELDPAVSGNNTKERNEEPIFEDDYELVEKEVEIEADDPSEDPDPDWAEDLDVEYVKPAKFISRPRSTSDPDTEEYIVFSHRRVPFDYVKTAIKHYRSAAQGYRSLATMRSRFTFLETETHLTKLRKLEKQLKQGEPWKVEQQPRREQLTLLLKEAVRAEPDAGIHLLDVDIQRMAREINKEKRLVDFNVSLSWIQRFKWNVWTPQERQRRQAIINERSKTFLLKMTQERKQERQRQLKLKAAEEQNEKLYELRKHQKPRDPKSQIKVPVKDERSKQKKERETMEKQSRTENTVTGRRERYANRHSATKESHKDSIR